MEWYKCISGQIVCLNIVACCHAGHTQSVERSLGSAWFDWHWLPHVQISTLKAENGELRRKLEESKAQLGSNEQMIRWLNQQVGVCVCAERKRHKDRVLLDMIRWLNQQVGVHVCVWWWWWGGVLA
jgi:hypothetical protein